MRLPFPILFLLLCLNFAFAQTDVPKAQREKANAKLRAELNKPFRQNNVDTLKSAVAEGADINTRSEDLGMTALMNAASRGRLDVVLFLMEHGAKIDAKDRDKNTALTYAVDENQAEVVLLFLQKGADVNTKFRWKQSLVSWAATYGHVEVLKFLLDNGAKVNVKDEMGNTPLDPPASLGNLEIVRLLLEHGADPNKSNALYWAAVDGHIDIVKLLLERGANVNAKNGEGKTALMSAKTEEVKQLLRSHGAKE